MLRPESLFCTCMARNPQAICLGTGTGTGTGIIFGHQWREGGLPRYPALIPPAILPRRSCIT